MKKSLPLSTQVIQILTILSAGVGFLSFFVYGPGRGMSLWGVDSALLEMLKTLVYALFLAGALSFPSQRRGAIMLLAIG